MKKAFVLMIVMVFAVTLTVTASMAVPPGKTVDYPDGDTGKVVFDGKIHADAGKKCIDCHPKLFQMKRGVVKFMMKDINEGKFCGTCHNGDVAFKASEQANCARCHKK